MSSEVTISLISPSFKYALVQTPSIRRGLVVQQSSGSPHLSLEPLAATSSWHLSGDIWFRETESLARGLYLADFPPEYQSVTESIVPQLVIASTIPDVFDGGTY